MIRLVIAIILLAAGNATAQSLYKSQKSHVKFFSDAPLEDIEATNTKSTALLKTETGEVVVLIKMKEFVFAKSLMQEHFNENYLESDKYPDATFKGKAPSKIELKNGTPVTIKFSGTLTIHGVGQSRDIPVTLQLQDDGNIEATTKFNVTVADHKIKVPSIVFKNIAEVVEVTSHFTLAPADK